MLDHLDEYPNLTSVCAAVSASLGFGAESLRRWVRQTQVDGDERQGVTSNESERMRRLERICTVLREQGVPVAERTYRAWKRAQPTARDLTDAIVIDAIRSVRVNDKGEASPESMYGRRKMTALLRRQDLTVSKRQVDRLMRALRINGLVRGKGVRTQSRIATLLAPRCEWASGDATVPGTPGDGSRTSPMCGRGPGSAEDGLVHHARRLHSTIGDVPPEELEAAYDADLETPSHPVMAPA